MLSRKKISNISFELEDVLRDGSCLYHCVNLATLGRLSDDAAKIEAAIALRKLVAKFLRDNRAQFEPMIQPAAEELFPSSKDCIKAYIDELESNYTFFSGEESIVAMANIFDLDITVYNCLGKVSARHSGNKGRKCIYLYFEYLHYQLIRSISFDDTAVLTSRL
jgi:hypothetical protein